jgi:AraC-like DNA-binding protein
MRVAPAAVPPRPDGNVTLGDNDPLLRQRVFQTCDLECARDYLAGVLVRSQFDYLSKERGLDFRHRQAQLGPIVVNSMQYGAGVMVTPPAFNDFYLLQFTLSGWCQIRQNKSDAILPPGSVAIVNPFRPFAKAWMPGARQVLLRIDRQLVEREFRAWTGVDDPSPIEFDLSPIVDIAKVSTLTRYVRMLCEDLRNEESALAYPHVRQRIASGLASILLRSMPHNRMRALESATWPGAPFFVRRVEQYIEEHAREAIALGDLTGVAGVSTRALQMGFRMFRNTTPMAYLRSFRMELARAELARAGQHFGSVTSVANAVGFAHMGRFAQDYKARFGESPSSTLSRGTVGPQ